MFMTKSDQKIVYVLPIHIFIHIFIHHIYILNQLFLLYQYKFVRMSKLYFEIPYFVKVLRYYATEILRKYELNTNSEKCNIFY